MPGPTIVCVSANPAMDRRLRVESLAVGEVNRAKSAQGLAGGKAAHVAMAARALEAQPRGWDFSAERSARNVGGKWNRWAFKWLRFPRSPARA